MDVKRLLASLHVSRDFNQAADALANMDTVRFAQLVWASCPSSKLCRLRVPEEWFSLSDLNAFAAQACLH
jgi:hypothetical protein